MAVVDRPEIVLLAGDLPFVDAATVTALVQRLEADRHAAGVVVLDEQRHPQWLLSAWRATPLRQVLTRAGDPAGRPLRSLLEPLAPVALVVPATGSRLPPWFDCDTPEDLARARRSAGGAA